MNDELAPAAELPPAELVFIAEARLPTPFADFTARAYRCSRDGKEHLALTLGDVSDLGTGVGPAPLVRMHSECLTGDALFSLRCDCGFQLRAALEAIAHEGRGALLYLRQEGRGIGLGNKIRAYALQDVGADTVEANHQLGFPADARDFGVAVEMLRQLGLSRIRLMTNNPAKLEALERDGIKVVERVSVELGRNPHNAAYLDTKALKMGHLLFQSVGSTLGPANLSLATLGAGSAPIKPVGLPNAVAVGDTARPPKRLAPTEPGVK